MLNDKPQTTYAKHYQVPDFLIDQVDLEFHLGEESTLVKSTLQVRANSVSLATNKKLLLLGEALELVSIELNGKTISASEYELTSEHLLLSQIPEHATLTIKTRIKPQENTELSGLYKSSGNFCTQCEAQGFRRITYFPDRPDVMSRYTTTIYADKTLYPILLSNGNLVASGEALHNQHWVKWEDPFRKPCYLFALVAGNLDFIEDYFQTASGRQVQIRIFVEKGCQTKCAHAMQAVKKAMRWDEEKYGREYDLDIYMIVAVSDFNMGAMENKGLNIFNTQYILATPETATDTDYIHIESVIAHEYFHNWTGNRITCRDWFQLSLKEGLTIFRDQSFTADTTSKAVARIQDVIDLRTRQFPEDAGPLTHPVRPESYIEINNFYTSTIYNKGAEVIRMLNTIVGEKIFRQGMDLYFERHDGQAVTIEDFVKAHEDAAGIDLTQFRLWYSQSGTPWIDVTDSYDANLQRYTLTIKQMYRPVETQGHKKPLDIPIKMGLIGPDGKEWLADVLRLKSSMDTFVFNDIPVKPVPSLLRNFSAPVKVKVNYTDHDLALLFQYDTDLFNRWEAGQQYAVNVILRLIEDYQQHKDLVVPEEFLSAFATILKTATDSNTDQWLLSEMLTLPSEKYLAEQMHFVDLDAIHAVREFVLTAIATRYKDDFLKIYQQLFAKPYEFNVAAIGERYLKNRCLYYLMLLHDPLIHENIGMRQFKLANNMTDTIAALSALANTDCPQREVALTEFYEKWKQDPLVVDKWLVLQASSKLPGTLQRVEDILHHAAFDIKNPNKVYSLIGAFGNNLPQFHAKSGEGYQFLTKIILQLNVLNPQVAARMLKPLTAWRRYDVARQHLMRKQLEVIAQDKKISKDVFEIVSKSLA